jgi:hypothetical protein
MPAVPLTEDELRQAEFLRRFCEKYNVDPGVVRAMAFLQRTKKAEKAADWPDALEED